MSLFLMYLLSFLIISTQAISGPVISTFANALVQRSATQSPQPPASADSSRSLLAIVPDDLSSAGVGSVDGDEDEDVERASSSQELGDLVDSDASLGAAATSSADAHPSSDVDGIQIIRRLAEGTFGLVDLASWNGRLVVVKSFKPAMALDSFRREIELSMKLKHERIAKVLDIRVGTKGEPISDENLLPANTQIILEYYEGGDLYDFVHHPKRHYSLLTIVDIALDILDAMEYMHANNVVHRDIKSLNIFIGQDGRVVLGDLGMSREIPQEAQGERKRRMTGGRGTPQYMAPEIILHQDYDHRADIYSFALLLWEMLERRVPYAQCSQPQMIQVLGQIAYKEQRLDFSPGFVDSQNPAIRRLVRLIQYCWKQDANKRPTISMIRDYLQKEIRSVRDIDTMMVAYPRMANSGTAAPSQGHNQ